MGDKQRAPGHHASAVNHHGQAAHFHREAAKHYLIGKDYAHAAHMALTAQGHALKAIWHGNEAQPRHDDFGVPTPEPANSVRETSLNIAEHHTAAADDHEQASRHYRLAADFYGTNDDTKADYEANIAHGYARHALFHGDEAAKHHVEHYGKSGPSAEIL